MSGLIAERASSHPKDDLSPCSRGKQDARQSKEGKRLFDIWGIFQALAPPRRFELRERFLLCTNRKCLLFCPPLGMLYGVS